MKEYFIWTLLIIVLLSIATSLGLYIQHFGVTLSHEHTIWAEFGSYFGGVPGSLFSLGSIIFLWLTIKENKRSSDEQLKAIHEGNFEARFNFGISNVRENSRYHIPDFSVTTDDKIQLRQALFKYYTVCQNDEPKRKEYIDLLWEEAEHYFMSIYYLIHLLEDESVSKSTLKRCLYNFNSQLTVYEKAWALWAALKWMGEDLSKDVEYYLIDSIP